MAMLWTTIALMVLTTYFVVRQVRSSRAPHVGTAAENRRCPRCHASVGERRFCSRCGVPMQVFDVATAPESREAVGEQTEATHAVVRADNCVGCGACVTACPEEGALVMRGKLAHVVLDKCVSHGDCVDACPVGAILVGRGDGGELVEVPKVDARFESNLPGIHIVGELGGRGLIKNAINEGKIAAESIVQRLRTMSDGRGDSDFDVAVVGAGPAGMSAALELHRSGLKYVVLEQGSLAESIRKYPRRKLLLAEPVSIPLYGDLWVADSEKESLLSMWTTIVRNTGLNIRTETRVANISRVDGDFAIEIESGTVRARNVILATGRRGTPRKLGVPGEELENVFFDVAEMEEFKGRRVLVVGGGDSALESALGVAAQTGSRVTLSYRGDSFKRAKERNLLNLERAVEQGRIEVLLNSNVQRIGDDFVEIEVGSEPRRLIVDDVIVRIGGEPPRKFLERIGINIVTKCLSASSEPEHVEA